MDKENNILSTKPFPLEIFAVPEANSTLEYCTGSNQKHLFVVFQEEENEEKLQVFLAKILSAAQFDIKKDVLLLKITNQKTFSFTEIRQKEPIKYAIFFGIPPTDFGLNFNFQPYEKFQHQDCWFLVVDDLAKIAENKQLKGALWSSLKEIFEI